MDGWISLHRALMEKPIWTCTTPQQKVILITLLLMAWHKPNEWFWKGKKFKTNPGQFITSLQSITEKSGKGITIKMVRTSLKNFSNYGFLANESAETGRLITIINWDSYQEIQNKRAKIRAREGQSEGKEGATNNNVTMNNVIKKYNFPLEYSDKLKLKFVDFIINRNDLKKPVTEKSFTGLVNKLKKISGSDEKISLEVLNESIINGWAGLFPLKQTFNNNAPQEPQRNKKWLK